MAYILISQQNHCGTLKQIKWTKETLWNTINTKILFQNNTADIIRCLKSHYKLLSNKSDTATYSIDNSWNSMISLLKLCKS